MDTRKICRNSSLEFLAQTRENTEIKMDSHYIYKVDRSLNEIHVVYPIITALQALWFSNTK